MGERTESLERMQQHSGGIMVCTDAAARGIDIPDVTHVIQVGAQCMSVCEARVEGQEVHQLVQQLQ
eukprot:1162124-Pelagomonas_calceolata.AAC.2